MPSQIDGLLYRRAEARPTITDDEYQLPVASSAPVRRDSFFDEPWLEVLDMHGADLSALSGGGALLINHDHRALPIGSVDRAWVDGERLYAALKFSKRDEAQEVKADIDDGIFRNVSIGYSVLERVRDKSLDDERLPGYRVTRWLPREVSIVSVPADFSVGFGRSENYIVRDLEGVAMPTDETREIPELDERRQEAAPVINLDAEREKARNEYRAEQSARRSAIADVFNAYGKAEMELRAACMEDENVTVEVATRKLLEKIATQSVVIEGNRAEITTDERDKFSVAIEDAIRGRSSLQHTADPRNEYRGMSMVEMFRRGLRLNGLPDSGTPSEIYTRAITSSDLPNILGNIANKSLEEAVAQSPETFGAWTSSASVPDFKANSFVTLGQVSAIEEVKESGEIPHGSISDWKETGQVVEYAQIVNFTRKSLINDDVNALTALPRLLTLRALQKAGDVVYSVVTTNAALSDAVALFDAGHTNVGTGGVPSTALVDEARVLMAKQTDRSGKPVQVRPRYALVPHALQGKMRSVLSGEYVFDGTATDTTQANYVAGLIPVENVVADHRLDTASATAWYLVGDPMFAPLVRVLYLNGQTVPFLDTEESFGVSGMSWKVRYDVGAYAVDYLGGVYNAGA